MTDNTKLIVLSIVKFLRKEWNTGKHSPDCAESLEVAIQCIESAYGLNEPEASNSEIVVPNLESLFSTQTASQSEAQKLADEYKNRGNALMQLDKYHEALEEYTKAIELYDKNAVYYCNRAAAYSKLGNHQNSIDDSKRAIELDPSYGKAYGRLGIAYSSLKRYEEAKVAYKKALELEPQNRSYHNNYQITEEFLRRDQSANSNSAAAGAQPIPIDLNELREMGDVDNIYQIFRNPTVINLASQMLGNQDMRDMMQGVLQDNVGEGGTPISAFLTAGQQLMEQLQSANPDLLDRIRRAMQVPGDEMGDSSAANDDSGPPQPPSTHGGDSHNA